MPKLPLISIPIRVGHDQTYAVTHCLKLVERYLGHIILILFDKGFKSKELRYTLDDLGYYYLILYLREKHISKELNEMNSGEQKLKYYEFKFTEGNSQVKGSTYLAFLKEVFDKRSN
ncbi:MAG: transposase [Nanoarchaeota archaeon]